MPSGRKVGEAQTRSPDWSYDETCEAIRLRQRAKMDWPEISARLPGRSVDAVKARLAMLGRFVITGDDSLPAWLLREAVPVYAPLEVQRARATLKEEIAAAKREAPLLRARGVLYRGAW